MSVPTSRVPVGLTDEQCIFFDTQGYLMVEDALDGDQLARVQEEFSRVEEDTREEWRRTIIQPPAFKPYGLGPTAHVVEPIVTHGDVFLDLLEHPRTLPIAEAFIGPDIQMIDNALHVKPAGTKAHTKWHRDTHTWCYSIEEWGEGDQKTWERIRACETPSFKMKIFFFIDDIDEDTAPFSVVPESHKLDVETVPQYDDLTDMPNHVKLVGKAGTAVLWNGHIWHTAMDNVGHTARRVLIYNYTHFGMKQYSPCVPTEVFAAYVRENRSPLCRQLLGLERMPRA